MLTSLLSLSLLLAAPSPKEAPKGKEESVEGKWIVVAVQGPKKDLNGETIFEFTKDTITIYEPQRTEKPVTYKIDWSKKPAEIDITVSPDLVLRGIIERKGEELKLCFGRVGKEERPQKFESNEDKVMFITFKLKKEEK
ncbi:MAG: TIGR03067 domain-containing protein [Gemmataceae bacterium]|jgi:uncharacterized protein (TIGR03067 family)|nr:TIGR03067 domain-containing protein [Gemmataceae bacterium]